MTIAVTHKQPPKFFKPLLWSYDFSRIDLERNKKVIIIHALNYGDLKHWRWIINYYGKDAIRGVIEAVPVTEFRARVLPLITLMFGTSRFHYAPRGSGRKA